ncbi:MAG: 1,4-dihydroxy-6-naphthoate synthase [Ferruginibacter sp.]
MPKVIEIGLSPCPNDTFIFDALINKKIETGSLHFNPNLQDVETLNEWALKKKLPVTKLSYGVLPFVLKDYAVLQSGSALGSGVGPLLLKIKSDEILNVDEKLIALPGENTTAHLLFSLAYPYAKNKTFLRYNEIENFVLDGKGLGVIIHENRFTYQDKGLEQVKDLGNFWEKQTGSPIPLGGIVVDRFMPAELQMQIDALIKKSIEYAFKNYPLLAPFVKENSQEMNEEVMRKHIELYVNEHSLALGVQGRAAVEKLLSVFHKMNKSTAQAKTIFVKEERY